MPPRREAERAGAPALLMWSCERQTALVKRERAARTIGRRER